MNDAIDIAAMALGAIGQPVRRKEDRRLLTGNGRFTDDFSIAGQTYAVCSCVPLTRMRGSFRSTEHKQSGCRVSSACLVAETASPTGLRQFRTVRCPRPDTI